jgi:hypothetical protein
MVICKIGIIVFMLQGIPFFQKAWVKGTIVERYKNGYVVDFQKDIIAKGFRNSDEYERYTVLKSECLEKQAKPRSSKKVRS